MSFVQPATLQVIADSVCIPKLSADAAKVLAPDVEYRLREIIQEAVKFKRHSKRAALSTDDISNALRLRNVQPVYGFANSSKDAARFLRAAGHSDLYFLEDREAPFDHVIGKSLPRPPIEVGLLPHWLAVDGVQPTIPENAPWERPRARKRQRTGAPAAPAAVTAAPAAAPGRQPAGGEEAADGSTLRAPVKHVLSQELQLYFDKVSEVLLNGAAAAAAAAQPPAGAGLQGAAAAELASKAQDGAPEHLERAVFASLSTDPGLAALVPYLVQLIGEGVAVGLKDLRRLHRLLAATRALLASPHVALAPYLHQLLPPVLTCLVARCLGDAPSADHWAVRDAAARLVAFICARFGDPLHNIQPRVSRTLLKALLDRSKPLTTHYGAIVGLAALGPRTVRLLLLPHMVPYLQHLQPLLGTQERRGVAGKPPEPVDHLQRAEALRCYGALQAAAVGAVYAGISDRLMDHLLTAPQGDAKRRRLAPAGEQPAAGSGDVAQRASRVHSVNGCMAIAQPAPFKLRTAAATNAAAPDNSKAARAAAFDTAGPTAATAAAASAAKQQAAEGKQGGAAAADQAADEHKADGAGAAADGQHQTLDRRKPAAPANALADAWKEDSDLGAQLQAVADLFGESALPWVPFQAAAGILL